MAGGVPWWLTVLLALLAPTGMLAGQWLSGRQYERRERAARNTRKIESRGKNYAEFLRAARDVRTVLRNPDPTAPGDAAVHQLRAAAADVALYAPAPVVAASTNVLDSTDQWLRQAATNAPGSTTLAGIADRYDTHVEQARQLMRADLDSD